MTTSKELRSAIILAAVLIAASLLFFGWQIQQPQAVFDEEKLAARIKKDILAELESDAFLSAQQDALIAALQEEHVIDDAVDAGIKRYIEKQQEAQQKAREEYAQKAQEKAKNVPRISERDHIYGKPDATITLIEYSDFECPFCKNFHPNPKQVVDDSDGQVNLVYRHYPLQFHNPGAQKQAEASECAAELGGSEAFWHYADLLYERTTSNGRGFSLQDLVPLAEEIGLDSEAFQRCYESGTYTERVKQDVKDAQMSGITGTPGTIVLNNSSGEAKLISGAQPVETLKQAVEELLE
ncbi:disulfide bond formation protein DsbA [candidate division KSB3 bacterium]|uniref:Disulfide bond formation protein DsbA n=1 Tax=candidate division KSB3 bacterium TaxID=2044937 RepID=A0A2G6E7K0_9BACT|nr:MAG: disulfide bond formation protein DsbA [candidate division KSB3 bacterium]PIE30172.1 MAG: disulfide bond formation protein DsbA [candidate division KSB3 bacterium]